MEQGGGDPCLNQSPPAPAGPYQMGPGLDQFLLLHLKCGGGEPGAGLASCSSYQSSTVTSLQGLGLSLPSP